jgi:hypothetical protein
VITGYLIADAAHDFTRIRRRQTWSRLTRKLRRRPDQETELLDFDDIVGPLRHAGRRNLGLHNLDIDTIVGSVGRVGDFDRWFRPRRPINRQRWEALDRASRAGAILPPIEVYKVGHLYFVRDGHHRVSIARAHGMQTIDALVTEVATTTADRASITFDGGAALQHGQWWRRTGPVTRTVFSACSVSRFQLPASGH